MELFSVTGMHQTLIFECRSIEVGASGANKKISKVKNYNIIETKKLSERINSRFELAEKGISKLEDRLIEIIQFDEKVKRMKKN